VTKEADAMATHRPLGVAAEDGAFDPEYSTAALGSVVGAVITALHRHGFVISPPLDLQRELRDRVGAYLVPCVVLFAFNPAATHRVLRRDPAAAAMTIVPLVIRGAGDQIAVEVPEAIPPADPVVEDVMGEQRLRLSHAVNEASVRAEQRRHAVPDGQDRT
jgi:hypothetical protein